MSDNPPSEKPPKDLVTKWLSEVATTEHGLLLNWYYERFQAVGRSQNRLIWAGMILSLAAVLIHFDPSGAKQLQLLGIQITGLAPILPAIIFLVLSALAGNLSTVPESLVKMKNMLKSGEVARHFDSSIFWSLDRNLNVLDFLAMAADKYWPKARMPVYPLYMGLVFGSALLQVSVQIVEVLGKPFGGQSLFLSINLVSGVYCYMVSRKIFFHKIEEFLRSRNRALANWLFVELDG